MAGRVGRFLRAPLLEGATVGTLMCVIIASGLAYLGLYYLVVFGVWLLG